MADGWRGECRRVDVAPAAAQAPWHGDRPIRLAWQRKDGELRIEPFCLGRDTAALCSRRTAVVGAGRLAGITIDGSDIPFAWLRPWLPAGLEADGSFDLRVEADKVAERNPRIEARASAGAMTLTALAAGEPLVVALSGASASLRTDGAGIALDWRLLLTGGASFSGEALLQQGSGALSGAMALRELDLAPFAKRAPGVVAAAGTLGGDVRLAGSLREPRVSGVLSLRDGMLSHEQLPHPIEDVVLDVEFAGAEARLAGRFGTAAGAGTLEGTARFGRRRLERRPGPEIRWPAARADAPQHAHGGARAARAARCATRRDQRRAVHTASRHPPRPAARHRRQRVARRRHRGRGSRRARRSTTAQT